MFRLLNCLLHIYTERWGLVRENSKQTPKSISIRLCYLKLGPSYLSDLLDIQPRGKIPRKTLSKETTLQLVSLPNMWFRVAFLAMSELRRTILRFPPVGLFPFNCSFPSCVLSSEPEEINRHFNEQLTLYLSW